MCLLEFHSSTLIAPRGAVTVTDIVVPRTGSKPEVSLRTTLGFRHLKSVTTVFWNVLCAYMSPGTVREYLLLSSCFNIPVSLLQCLLCVCFAGEAGRVRAATARRTPHHQIFLVSCLRCCFRGTGFETRACGLPSSSSSSYTHPKGASKRDPSHTARVESSGAGKV